MLQVEGTNLELRRNKQENVEENGKLVAQSSENGMIKMKVCLKFSAGLCSIESDYHLINHTNQDLIIMVQTLTSSNRDH